MSFLYLGLLLFNIGCMLLLDFRFRLFFGKDPAAATLITAAGTIFLLLWDMAGIANGIFIDGAPQIATGWLLAPNMPIEEPVFLIFLVLCTMVLYTGFERILQARKSRRAQ